MESRITSSSDPARTSTAPEGVHARFARSLPGRIEQLCAAVERAACGAGIEPARREAHKLAGTAGTFGHDRVSRAARRLEALLTRGPGSEEVDAALAELQRAAITVQPAALAAPVDVIPRILLVEAHARDRERAEQLAARVLAEVVTVADLPTALQHAHARRWDGVIVDASLGLAESAWVDAVHHLRRAGGRSVPLAVTSSDDGLDARIAAAHAGADLFLRKPLSAAGLSEAIALLCAITAAVRPRVLAVDDDPAFLAVLSELLADDGIEMASLSDPRGLVDALRRTTPAALLLDLDMPGVSGTELCALLRADREFRELPILFVTGSSDAATRLRAFEAGADDYVLKPVVAPELCARVRARIERSSMLRAQTERDSLTGLPLRSVWATAVEARLSEASRRDTPVTVCLLDLDQFKLVNDLHGHLAGDRALAELGRLLATRFRTEDLRCRWGGEEFALAFPGERAETIHPMMERVLAELSAMRLVADDGASFGITFSAGIAERPGDGVTLEPLVRAADRRLYAAKAAGRRRVVSAG